MRALAANSAGGGKSRFSRSMDWNVWLSGEVVSAAVPLPWL
jgi:hypothetical protein